MNLIEERSKEAVLYKLDKFLSEDRDLNLSTEEKAYNFLEKIEGFTHDQVTHVKAIGNHAGTPLNRQMIVAYLADEEKRNEWVDKAGGLQAIV